MLVGELLGLEDDKERVEEGEVGEVEGESAGGERGDAGEVGDSSLFCRGERGRRKERESVLRTIFLSFLCLLSCWIGGGGELIDR